MMTQPEPKADEGMMASIDHEHQARLKDLTDLALLRARLERSQERIAELESKSKAETDEVTELRAALASSDDMLEECKGWLGEVIGMVAAKGVAGQSDLSRAQALAKLLQTNNFVDTDWYLEANLDVKRSKKDPRLHYVLHGAKENRLPRSFKSEQS